MPFLLSGLGRLASASYTEVRPVIFQVQEEHRQAVSKDSGYIVEGEMYTISSLFHFRVCPVTNDKIEIEKR